jgi:NhaP-type Na+/H+ or K+/H+ antiporter
MTVFATWALVIGGLMVTMGLIGSLVKRLPIAPSALYLLFGLALGPLGAGLITLDLDDPGHVRLLEIITEVAVLISLFGVGLRLRVRMAFSIWRLPVQLASVAMVLTIAGVCAVGVGWLGLPLGAAILAGAILAPTDPVLASDVQMANTEDRDIVRFGLTGEGGLNDGTAFPFAMLGLGLLGYHELGPGLTRWIAVDLVWATLGGLGIGAALGLLASKTILALRMRFHEAVGLESHFTLGLIGVAYGTALLASTYGFLAVFAAGVAMRHVEREENPNRSPEEVLGALPAKELEQIATHENKAAAYLTQTVSEFSFDVERLAELCVTLLIGTMLTQATFSVPALGTALLLILLIRPLSVYLSTIGMRLRPTQRRLTAWFGIRGIGSMYYLFYSIAHAPDMPYADLLLQITLCTVVVSIVLHGSTATPLMAMYQRIRQ